MKIEVGDFGEEHLIHNGVWTWQNDLHTSENVLVPVSLTEEALAACDSLLIHACFRTSSGKELTGIVVYQIGSNEVFAIEIIIGKKKYSLNRYLVDLSMETVFELASDLQELPEHLLPISYSIIPKELAINDGVFILAGVPRGPRHE